MRELTGIEEEIMNLEKGVTLKNLVFKFASRYAKISFGILKKGIEIINLSLQLRVNGVTGRNLYGLQMKLKNGYAITIVYSIIGG